ncbi:hypothetical protein CTAYLR_006246 [Chrysophaeum taylorii]|uniref:Nop domain-containing protein n=1 Tax=Chrysophaeum taylorii TaxID=2483200 RepID=A0AAD7XNU2_9STRA|nr:hypothetical protein CTAYLR_006246 [Chrysophaeum taylorii]
MATPLALAPRENMALTLADSFLNDLEALEASSDDDDDEEEEAPLEEVLESMGGQFEEIGKLRGSERYRRHLAAIRKGEGGGEYQLIVESNEVLEKIEAEIGVVHRRVEEIYSRKFPELGTLVPSKVDYVRVVKRMRNETDMTKVDLSDILPPSVVMVVSVTGSTTSGGELSSRELEACVAGCDEVLGLEEDKGVILEYIEARMAALAPNLTRLLNSSGLAAMLVGMAGGLDKLAVVPACNLTVMGQEKRTELGGFGMTAAMPHTGVLFFCDLVQTAPGFLQKKVLKMIASKASLAARVDAFGSGGAQGQQMRDEIKTKIEKLCEPPKAQKVKALPPPDVMTGKKKRGGKRVRKANDKLRMTEMRTLAAKRAFGLEAATEYGDDSMGLDTGLLTGDSNSARAPLVKDKKKKKSDSSSASEPKRKMVVQMSSSGATNGLSSSLVFTPVQGIELANPTAQQQQQKVDAANEKWFSSSSGFQSALPQ